MLAMKKSKESLSLPQPDADGSGDPASPERRWLICSALAAGALAPLAGSALADDSKEGRARPQAGDVFVFADGDNEGKTIVAADIPLDSQQIMAWPMNPETSVVRDGSRLNQVMLIRLDQASLDEATKARAAEGILAFSAICTHQQCPVTEWRPDTNHLRCPCHESEFDPRADGKPVGGPARRKLASLPVKLQNGQLVAAGTFIGKVGTVA
jgi:Rieske Fe-S protein